MFRSVVFHYRYGDYYLGKGFDVVHVKVKTGQLIYPPKAQGVVTKVICSIVASRL